MKRNYLKKPSLVKRNFDWIVQYCSFLNLLFTEQKKNDWQPFLEFFFKFVIEFFNHSINILLPSFQGSSYKDMRPYQIVLKG